MATTMHWEPNSSAPWATISGVATARVLNDTLSAPARSIFRTSAASPDPAADGEGDEDLLGDAGHDVDHGVPGVGAGRDVEEDELVGALGVVAGGQLDGVAGVAQADEVDALHDPAGVDVEAGDHTGAKHASASSTVKRPS